eukprot:CAMPEP_0172539992 /NCGR_PEP_ID=MMETSP1067-20121228/11086_1 /TAXON_ID=265564 ORGANISM="Thalassiosira punctigera, Strain Tpunct2005C2" /NCGR_SAMPLE_ID=MMETSP1067 /ASSEMBLY_ACC=CAM_ASM_000444 /LENGTH=47 /DNA_ID= /DNA_START= /DNA_END= /DNA_ORIENTATION=
MSSAALSSAALRLRRKTFTKNAVKPTSSAEMPAKKLARTTPFPPDSL